MNQPQLTWEDSVWFSDIDDTLINTANLTTAGSESIRTVFQSCFGQEIAEKIQKNFQNVFNTLLFGHRRHTPADWEDFIKEKEAYDALVDQITNFQQEIKEQYGSIRRWSREVFIKIACDQEMLAVDPETIYEAGDAYWLQLSEKTELLPGVVELIHEIKRHNKPLFLVTGSDARLKLKSNGQFAYDPAYSETFKRQRIQLLREKGLEFNTVSIGDPEDKPHLDFFQKGVKAAEEHIGHPIDLSKAIMIGDGYPADLQVPKEQMGFGLVVLYQPGKQDTEVRDEHYVETGNLANISQFLR